MTWSSGMQALSGIKIKKSEFKYYGAILTVRCHIKNDKIC
jgi:hypothetical protein